MCKILKERRKKKLCKKKVKKRDKEMKTKERNWVNNEKEKKITCQSEIC